MMISTAYAELTRVLPWSLRALGYAFPVADRASHIITAAAAMDPDVLDKIGSLKARSAAANLIEIDDGGQCRLDAKQHTLFEVGPAVIDYLGGQASDEGFVRAELHQVSALETLPAVLVLGSSYGLTTAAFVETGGTRAWFLQVLREGKRHVLRGMTAGSLQATVADAGDFGQKILAEYQSSTPNGTCVVLAIRTELEIRFDVPEVEIVNADAAVDRAMRSGIAVKNESLKEIYDLEKRTWAPTSERSRSQAGFQQPAGGAA